MKKILIFTCLLLPAAVMAFQTGPRAQANFGNKNDKEEKTAAQAANSTARALSTYGQGRTWDRRVRTQVAGQPAPEKENRSENEPRRGFVDKADSQLAGLDGLSGKMNKEEQPKQAPKAKKTAMPAFGSATVTKTAASSGGMQPGVDPREMDEETAAPSKAATETMPEDMGAVMQQMGQMQDMMNMLGNMGGATGGANAPSGGAGGGMPAGMPDISALMGGLGGLGGNSAPAKK